MSQAQTKTPPLAIVLTAAGAVPFIALASAAFIADVPWQGQSLDALMTYAAVILAFMGAIHWGLALAPGASSEPSASLLAGVVPALVGWGATMLPVSLVFTSSHSRLLRCWALTSPPLVTAPRLPGMAACVCR